MKSLKENCYSPVFSHIYVEDSIWDHPRTKAVLKRFPNAYVIKIRHYKDVFCRNGQNYVKQHRAQSLILANKQGRLIYEGAPVCQSFGNTHFYYTSCIMNCIYDCEYCYLKGMYPSGHIVVFVNIEDIFKETEELLKRHPVYLCVSYDTDLMALETIAGYVGEWVRFCETHQNIQIEVRTKCANIHLWDKLKARPEIVYAFTLSPQQMIDAYEHGTPPLGQRILCAAEISKAGFPVRLCFDPMIYKKGWEEDYAAMTEEVFSCISSDKITDVSIGSFRISQDYLKKLQKCEPYSAAVQFPFENDGGVYHYPTELMHRMEQFLFTEVNKRVPKEQIFLWR